MLLKVCSFVDANTAKMTRRLPRIHGMDIRMNSTPTIIRWLCVITVDGGSAVVEKLKPGSNVEVMLLGTVAHQKLKNCYNYKIITK